MKSKQKAILRFMRLFETEHVTHEYKRRHAHRRGGDHYTEQPKTVDIGPISCHVKTMDALRDAGLTEETMWMDGSRRNEACRWALTDKGRAIADGATCRECDARLTVDDYMEAISIRLSDDQLFDDVLKESLPEGGDLAIVTKAKGTVNGQAIVALTFTVAIDGKPHRVQAVTTARNFMFAAAAVRGRHGDDGMHDYPNH